MSDITWAKPGEPHKNDYTRGHYCHNCRYLSCIKQKYRTDPWHYFCETSHGHLGKDGMEAMTEEKCPIGDDGKKWLK